MVIVILLIFVVIVFIIIANSDSKTNAKKTEQQRQIRLQNEQAERERQASLLQQRQAEQQKQAEKEQLRQQAEQQRHQAEQEKQATQRRADIVRQEQEVRNNQIAEENRQKVFCESGTDYCTALDKAYNANSIGFRFNTLRNLSKNCGVWNELNSGVAQLCTYEQLSQYVFSYGLMHQAKLQQAFLALFSGNYIALNGQGLEIIDYGCGQGIGTICLIDHIKTHTNKNCKIKSVKLIEPSELTLKRAALNVRYALRGCQQLENVYAINKELDDLTQQDLATQVATTKIHIFSNIIDVEGFSIQKLQENIVSTQHGINFFVCVSPNIMQSRNQRLDWFQQYFINKGEVTLISNRETDIPNPSNAERPYKRYERIFKVQLGQFAAADTNAANLTIGTQVIQGNDLLFKK